MIKQRINISLTISLIYFSFSIGFSQDQKISLEEALTLAVANYTALEVDQLVIDKYDHLSNSAVPLDPAQVYLSGEEFGSNGTSGIHSINIQQNFNLPKVSNAYKTYFNQNANVAKQRLALTKKELELQVSLAFYQLLYAKESQEILADNVEAYNHFLSITNTQVEVGETGKLPSVAARSKLNQMILEENRIKALFQLALNSFNQWLGQGSNYDASGNLELGSADDRDSIDSKNPHISIIESQKLLANTKIETEKAKLLPQINTGLKLQTAFGEFPLFGYQIGVNIPLFKGAYQRRIEASEMDVHIQDAALRTKEQELLRTINELSYKLELEQNAANFIMETLIPVVREQSELNLIAYREGEVGYLEYLQSLDQWISARKQYLDALYQIQVLRVQLDYWTGT